GAGGTARTRPPSRQARPAGSAGRFGHVPGNRRGRARPWPDRPWPRGRRRSEATVPAGRSSGPGPGTCAGPPNGRARRSPAAGRAAGPAVSGTRRGQVPLVRRGPGRGLAPDMALTDVRRLRELFLLDPDIVFLNHGSFGACPRPVFEEYQRWQLELERRPVE